MLGQLKKESQTVNIKYVALGGAFGLAVLAGYFIYKSSQSNKTPTILPEVVQVKEAPQESPQKALIRVINSIKRQVLNHKNLTTQSTKAIYQSQFELSQRQFKPLTIKNRQERRKVIDNIKQYFELFQSYEQDLAKLHDKHLNSLLAHFKIDKADWIQAVQQLSTNDPQFLLDVEYGQLDVLRKKDMPKVKFPLQVEISKLKVKLLEQKGGIFSTIEDIEISDLVNLIERWLHDKIYQQYKIQIEDLIYSKEDLTPQEKAELNNHDDNYREILNEIVSGDDDEDQGLFGNGQ